MSYPISINKKVSIHNDSLNYDKAKIIRIFKSELKKLEGIEISISENKIELKECIEFSSRGLRLKNLNKGSITLEQNNGFINIKSKIILIEHIILFASAMIFGVFGIIHYSEMPELVGITIILLLAISTFCYLMPLMTFNSFFNETVKKIESKEKLKQSDKVK